MADERILNKIKSCMVLAQRSTNPHEAAVALAHAQKLMAKHGVDGTELALSAIGMSDADGGAYRATHPRYYHFLLAVVQSAFGVQAVIGGSKSQGGHVTFIGVSPNDQLAAYAFEVLWPQLTKARSEYVARLPHACKRTTKIRRGDAFAEGWCNAIYRQVSALKPTEVEASLIQQAIAAKFPAVTDSKVRELDSKRNDVTAAATAGYRAGRDVRLHQPVSGRETVKLGSDIG